MRFSFQLCVLFVVVSAGCASTPPAPSPALDGIVKVRLSVQRFPKEMEPREPCEKILTQAADIKEVVDWLRGIDWSQEGTDLTVVSIPAPDGRLELTSTDGATSRFAFYWNGGLIHEQANRLIQAGNVAKLKQLVQRVCQ